MEKRKPIVIGVTGGSGSGKTSVSRKILENFPELTIVKIDQDYYYKDQSHMPFEDRLKTSIKVMEERFNNIQTGRANPRILDKVEVIYYSTPTPLKQLAVISIPEARQLQIKPFDKSTLSLIEKAIFESNIGLTPNNDGEVIRINMPQLTMDRRKGLVKEAKNIAEETKIAVRNIRKDILNSIEEEREDEVKRIEKEVQNKIDEYNHLIDKETQTKEKELLEV